MTAVKICGVTTVDDALGAARAGADMLGLNFYGPSPRFVTIRQASRIAKALHRATIITCPILVGLFVNAAAQEIRRTVDEVGLDLVQLSGDESPEEAAALDGRAVKSIRPRTVDEAVEMARAFGVCGPRWDWAPSLILDAYHPHLYGGTGEQARAGIALAALEVVPRLMLAGGLTPANVAEVIRTIHPWGVDVASGVEGLQKGRKDMERMRDFVRAVRQVDISG